MGILACILIATGTARIALAQEPQRLTLSEALDRAEKRNLDLQAARAQRAVVLAGVRIAGQRPNPSASVGVLRDSPHESLVFDQPLEIGSKRKKRIELAQQEGALTEAGITALERQVRRDTREAYFGLAFARRATAARTDIAKLAERLRDIARARYEAGDIPQLEVTQADLELSRANADAQVARREEQIALSRLNLLLNAPTTSSWELLSDLESSSRSLGLEELVEKASGTNAEIARLAQEAKVEESRANLLKAERIPNLGVQFGVDFNAPNDFREGPRGQLTMELPIFARNQGEIAQSSASLHAIEQEALAKRRAIASQVEAAFYELNAREEQVILYRRMLVPASRQLEEMAEESYRAGKANILTVLGAQRDVQQVENEYLNSLLAMQTSFAALEETVGMPLD
jgi:cobalt-zinc-cadmium efflux system outer membrane protein